MLEASYDDKNIKGGGKNYILNLFKIKNESNIII